MRVLLLALCACNAVFGVKDTRQVDARYYDAHLDAAWGCPALGTPPALDPQLHQDVLQWCQSYAVAAGHAIATCNNAGLFGVYEGVPDGVLAPAKGVPLGTGEVVYDEPRLSSDGNELYVRSFNYSTSAEAVLLFTRGSDGTWVQGASPPFGSTANDNISTIVAGPTGDRVFVWNGIPTTFEEWVHEPAGWRDAATVSIAALVPTSVTSMNPITAERALVVGFDRHTYYIDRLDVASPFRPGVRMAEIPDYAFDAAMTPDCGRVYVTGLHSVFYVQQP